MSDIHDLYDFLKKLDYFDIGTNENKNKITLQHVSPPFHEKTSIYQEPAFLAVSLESLAFLNKKFAAIMKYLGKFPDIALYIVDSPYRYTIKIKYDVSEEEATKLSQVVAAQTVAHQREVCRMIGCSEPRFVHHSTLETRADYVHLQQRLERFFEVEPAFQSVVQHFCEFYLTRIRDEMKCSVDKAVNLSRQYLLAELTAVGILNGLDYPAMLYPGKIDSISGFLELELPEDIATYYRDFKFASLRNNRRKKK